MGAFFSKLIEWFKSKKLELCLVGLENSGKTTLLSVLTLGQPIDTLPTVGLNVKVVKKDNVNMKCWDLGGQERFRSEWPKYTSSSDVIVFVVDSHDTDKIPTAKSELHKLLEDKNVAGIPLLICLNKIDLDPHYSKAEIVKLLNLDFINDRPWLILNISALKCTGIDKVVDWLISHSK